MYSTLVTFKQSYDFIKCPKGAWKLKSKLSCFGISAAVHQIINLPDLTLNCAN